MPAVEDLSVLSSIALFEGVVESDLEQLNQLLHKKSFPSGTNVITVSDRTELVFVLLEGTVKIYVDQLDGSEVILAFLGPGDTFGEMGMVGSGGRSANVVTLERRHCASACTFPTDVIGTSIRSGGYARIRSLPATSFAPPSASDERRDLRPNSTRPCGAVPC